MLLLVAGVWFDIGDNIGDDVGVWFDFGDKPVFLECPTYPPPILPMNPPYHGIAENQWTAAQLANPGNQTFSRICESPLDPCSKIQPPVLSCESPPQIFQSET